MAALEPTSGNAGAVSAVAGGGPGAPARDLVTAVALAANTASSLHEALTAAATAVCDATGWPVCVVWESTSVGGELVPTVVAVDGETEAALPGLAGMEPVAADGLGVVASMFRADAAAVMYQLDGDSSPAGPAARQAGLHTGAAFAIAGDGHVAAVLEFLAPSAAELPPPLVSALDTVVRQLSFVAQRQRPEGVSAGGGDGLADTFATATDAFIGLDADGYVQAWNRQAQLLFGWTRGQVLGRADALAWLTPPVLADTDGDCPLARLADNADAAGRTGRLTLRHRHGAEVPVWATAWTPHGSELATALLLRPATYDTSPWPEPAADGIGDARDPLTGLPARPAFLRRLAALLRDRVGVVVVATVDVDRLADVNRRYGLGMGDAALVAVARRLERFSGATGRVARWGDDELVLALTHVDTSEPGLRRLGWELIELFETPLEDVNPPLTVGVTVGLATSDDLDDDPSTLVGGAREALHRARQRGARRVGRYDPATDQPAPDQERLNADLRSAIEDDQLELHYQPQIDMRTGRTVAVEALVRWRHPDLGLVSPDRFIPEAERAGLIRQLGHQVLRTALADLTRWRRAGHPIDAMAVNLSAAQLDHPDFHDTVADLVAQHGLTPRDVVLEITETALSQDTNHAIGQLTALRAAGFRIAVDDFGCGYSTLSRVHSYPFDEVKLDRAFITDVVTFDQPAPVLDAAVAMAHGLGMQVVIEGVETQPQLAAAMRAGCDKAQGFLLSRPLTADQLHDRLDHPDT